MSAHFLDLVVVVIGVFIGIQVSNWNDFRVTQQHAEVLSARLNDDFGVDAWVGNGLLRYPEDVKEYASRGLPDLADQEQQPEDMRLIAAHRASQFNRFTPSSSNYDKLVASGGLELVGKTDVVGAAAVFYGSTVIDEIEAESQSSQYRHFFRKVTPIDVQLEVRRACGDRNLPVQDVLEEISATGYPCTPDSPAERLAAAARALRQSPQMIDSLRHRNVTPATQLDDFETIVDAIKPYRADQQGLSKSFQFAVLRTGK